MVCGNLLLNCLVTINDINATTNIVGSNVLSVRGETRHQASERSVNDYGDIPPQIKELNQQVVLCGKVIYKWSGFYGHSFPAYQIYYLWVCADKKNQDYI